jgi:protein involved in polysaccharide export with SLBB domain
VEQTTVLDPIGTDPKAREFLLKDGDILLVPVGNTFYVLGEVKKPGTYQIDQASTTIQGIAMAGGFTDKAAPNRTKIIRTHPDGRQETLVVDLNEVLKRGRKDKELPLIAGDVVGVPESFFCPNSSVAPSGDRHSNCSPRSGSLCGGQRRGEAQKR